MTGHLLHRQLEGIEPLLQLWPGQVMMFKCDTQYLGLLYLRSRDPRLLGWRTGQVWGSRGMREAEAALHHVSQLHHTAAHTELPARPGWAPQPPGPSLLLRPHPGQDSCTPRDGCHPAGVGAPSSEMLTNPEHHNLAVPQSLCLTHAPAQVLLEKQPGASSILMALPLKPQSHW